VVKAATLEADVVILELEDGVNPENKAEARNAARRLLAEIDFGNRETAVRINRISNQHGLADMTAMAQWPCKPDLIILPKVESAEEVRLYDELLTNIDVPSRLLILIESSRGILAAPKIAAASTRVAGLAFGIADLAAELGCGLSWEVMAHQRCALISAGGLAGVPVIDAPHIHIKDSEGLIDECARARDFGFSGKLCIHPSQLAPVNSSFSPTEEEIARAVKIVAVAESKGSGAIVVDGRMVDLPVIKLAKRVVSIAKEMGRLPEKQIG
jgi:citrate lyase beta subunit